MGAPMCGHLLDAGHDVTVYSRTRSKAQALVDRGARWAASPREAVAGAEFAFTMVGFPDDVRAVYLGDDGILQALTAGAIAVDMTTTAPSLAKELNAAAWTHGVATVDAPVSGGDVGAQNATLSIMVGGDKDAVANVWPFFEILGKNIVREGPAGAGQHTKMCNQIVIAGTMIGVCESLLYGAKAGLDMRKVLDAIGGGAAACWALTNLAPRVVDRNFDPGFYVDHFVKDMGLALEEARRMNLTLPGLTLVHSVYERLQTLGHGRKGTHALILALEAMAADEPGPER